MKRMMKCLLCSAFLLLLIPFAVHAEGGDLEELAVQIGSAGTIDSQLALINDAADAFSDDLAAGGWDIPLNAAPAEELPAGLLPDNYDDAQQVDALPDELKEGSILALYDDEGTISLLGDFMARFSPSRRASSLDSAEIMLVVRHIDNKRTDYIGSAYDRVYYGYIWRIGSDDIYTIFYKRNTPPVSGMGTLYGSSMSKHALWDTMRFSFFDSKVISGDEGFTTTYTFMNDGWYLSGLEGDRLVLDVPGEIDGYPVVTVAASMTNDCPSLTRIILPEGMKYLEDGIFRDLDQLTDVTLPQSLVSIGANVFEGCDALAELTIPDNVEKIGSNAFSNMNSLKQLKLPAAPVTLGNGVIKGFNRIGSLALPEGITELPDGCFQDSYGLTALYVPVSVVNFPETIPDWIRVYTPEGSPAQMWASKLGIAAVACSSAEEMPQISVEQEEQYCYVVCDDEAVLVNTEPVIQYVNLPDTLGGAPLTTIRHAFYRDDTIVYLNIPEGVTTIGNDFCYISNELEQVVFPSTLTEIGRNAFYSCYSLQSLALPDGLESIGASMATDCSSLEDVTLPASLTEIPENFLQNDTLLTSLIVPEGVRRISAGALGGCTGIFSLYLPESLVQIDASLPSQISLFAPEGSPALMWAEKNQYNCRALADPSQMPLAETGVEGDFMYVLYDGEAFLKNYTGTEEVLVIPDTLGGAPVTRILSQALPNDSLTSVTVADSVRRLDYQAFYDNDYLDFLYLPGTIEYMDDGAIRSIYHDCTVYAPEGSYAWDFVSRDLNCSGGHVFTLEHWDHESAPAGTQEETSGFFPSLDSLFTEPLLTYGNYAHVEPDETGTLEDGTVCQYYHNVSQDDYYNYGTALGEAGYSIVNTITEGGVVTLRLALDDITFTMSYDVVTRIMEFEFPADANLG